MLGHYTTAPRFGASYLCGAYRIIPDRLSPVKPSEAPISAECNIGAYSRVQALPSSPISIDIRVSMTYLCK